MRTLSYSNVKYTLRVPLSLLTVEKIEYENFDFVLFSFFPSRITQKLYNVYEQSAHQMSALLSEFLLFLVRATCELRSPSYASKTHIVISFQYICQFEYLNTQLKS